MFKGRVSRSRQVIGLLVVTLLAVGVSAFKGKAYANEVAFSAPLSLTCGDCFNCQFPTNRHFSGVFDDPPSSDYDIFGQGHEDCLFTTCSETYDQCPSATNISGAVYALRKELGGANGAEVVAITASLGKVALLNEKRMAVQVLGCKGDVVAHFPLSKRQASEIEALRAN